MALPAKKTVELFYDVISPYSWIGFEVLCRYQKKWNIDLQLKPFLLAGVMKASDNRPPMMVASKGVYMGQDLHRLRSFYQVPISRPADVFNVLMNKGSLSAQRLLTAVNQNKPQLTEAVSRELWMRVWGRDEDITTPDSLMQVLKSTGMKESEAAELLKVSADKTISDKLKQITKEAVDAGAFGAPAIVIKDSNNEKQMLFGSDRFEVLAWMLGEKYEGPLRELAASKL